MKVSYVNMTSTLHRQLNTNEQSKTYYYGFQRSLNIESKDAISVYIIVISIMMWVVNISVPRLISKIPR